MTVMGFSINTLTLFGLVLAIGIVVDDAIVVVENVSRNMDETGLNRKDATIQAMREVTGPVIATTLVLLAVFVPIAFMGGMTGVLYKQFALTIATATVFSSINALTLSPALCALVLKPGPESRRGFFRLFNWGLSGATGKYEKVVGLMTRRTILAVALYALCAAGVYFGMINIPGGFVPDEDQGYLMVNTQLPDGASLQRTQKVVDKINKIVADTPGVENNMAIVGYSLLDGTANSNTAANIVIYKNWDERADHPEMTQEAILNNLRRNFARIQEGMVMAFTTPALPGLGMAGGFDMLVQDRGDVGLDTLQKVTYEMIRDGNAQPGLTSLYTTFRADVPQLFVDVDRVKVKKLNVPLSVVFDTLQSYLGSTYVNDFNKFGRTYQVRAQAAAPFRAHTSDIEQLQVRNADNNMLPLGTLVSVDEYFGPQVITRYNMYPSSSIQGSAAPGYSSGQALELMSDMARQKLPSSMGYEWTGISYQEILAGGQVVYIFAIAVIFVYLVLAAQYESWKIPAPVILSVPMALLGAFGALLARHMDNNVYTQIGLVLLIGLASKNAILIVEFAKDAHEKGKGVVDSAIEAARLRFRPILMTSFSFILGVVPLLIATGAGAGSRRALGTAVFGGMMTATLLGVIIVPSLYVIFQRMGERTKKVEKG